MDKRVLLTVYTSFVYSAWPYSGSIHGFNARMDKWTSVLPLTRLILLTHQIRMPDSNAPMLRGPIGQASSLVLTFYMFEQAMHQIPASV